MTSRADIEREINKKYAEWTKQPFNLVKLPDDIIETFDDAMFIVPPDRHLLLVNDIRDILSKKPEELSNLQVGHVINVILAASPMYLYKDKAEYLLKGGIYGVLKNQYNKMVKDKEELLKAEGNSKMRFVTTN